MTKETPMHEAIDYGTEQRYQHGSTKAGLTPIPALIARGMSREEAWAFRDREKATQRAWRGKVVSITAPAELAAANARARAEAEQRRSRLKHADLDHFARSQENAVRPTLEFEGKAGAVSVPTDDAGVFAQKARIECVLDRYHQRMMVNDRQFHSGLRFHGIWRAAALPMSVCGGYGENRGGGSGAMGNNRARERLRDILVKSGLAVAFERDLPIITTMTGERFEPVALPLRLRSTGRVVVDVCGLGTWAGGTRRLDDLREGLGLLADYWGVEMERHTAA